MVSLNFENENNAEERRKSESSAGGKSRDASQGEPRSRKSAKPRNAGTPEVGHALRTIYQRTLEANIPPDLLYLLGKLD